MEPKSHHIEYFPRLKSLVEGTYENNGNRRVVLVGHGLGGLMVNHFLESMSPEWKRKYVQVFVPVSVPWVGSVKALYDYETGGFFKTDSLAKKILYREIYSTWETAKLLLPQVKTWNDTRPFLNYDDICDDTSVFSFKKIVQPRHPGVNILSLVSSGKPTIESFDLHDEWYTSVKHTFKYGKGDGSVNQCSLNEKLHLYRRTGFTANSFEYDGCDHHEVLSSVSMIHIMKRINGLLTW